MRNQKGIGYAFFYGKIENHSRKLWYNREEIGQNSMESIVFLLECFSSMGKSESIEKVIWCEKERCKE